MLHVERAVAATSGVALRAEVKLVGFPSARVAPLGGTDAGGAADGAGRGEVGR